VLETEIGHLVPPRSAPETMNQFYKHLNTDIIKKKYASEG